MRQESVHNNNSLKYIFILSCVIAIIYPIVNIYAIFPLFSNVVIKNAEADAVRITNLLMTRLNTQNAKLTKDSITPEFSEHAEQIKENLHIWKFKVFSSTGEVLFSTDPQDMGKVNANEYFHEIVAKGNSYAKHARKYTETLEGQLAMADVMETYVLVMIQDSFAGAFEVYDDITNNKNMLNAALLRATVIPLFLMCSFLLLILLILYKTDKSVFNHHRSEMKRYQSPIYILFIGFNSIIINATFTHIPHKYHFNICSIGRDANNGRIGGVHCRTARRRIAGYICR